MTNKIAKREKQDEIEINTKKAQKDIFLEYMPYLIIIFFVVIIRIFIATPVKVNGSSMYPTLYDGDTMLLYKLTKKIHGINRFDIVVINTDSGKLIKRVIGLPGDKIKYETITNEDGKIISNLYVNDKIVLEDFINEEARNATCKTESAICSESGLIVPEDEYFVMGDNRINSKDSRMLGTIPEKEITGTTELILFPFNRIGKAD